MQNTKNTGAKGKARVVTFSAPLHKSGDGASGQPSSHSQGVSLDGCFWKKLELPCVTSSIMPSHAAFQGHQKRARFGPLNGKCQIHYAGTPSDSPEGVGQVVSFSFPLHKTSDGASGQPSHDQVSIDGCFWKKLECAPLMNLYRVTVPTAPERLAA
jgi:hypothetical protein